MPGKNMSRAAGVSLNWHLQPSMFDDPTSVRANDIFVLFLTARDRSNAGMIEEIAVGVIGADYKDFVFYETLEDFLRGYGEGSVVPLGPDDSDSQGAEVKLRKTRKLFLPPENRPDSDVADGSNE